MAKYEPNFDVTELSNRIQKTEQKMFMNVATIYPAMVTVPEFAGRGGLVQINIIDGLTRTKRRFKVYSSSFKPIIEWHHSDIDNPINSLVSEVPENWSNDNRVINEIVTMIHLKELVEVIWGEEYYKDPRHFMAIIVGAIFYDSDYVFSNSTRGDIIISVGNIDLFQINVNETRNHYEGIRVINEFPMSEYKQLNALIHLICSTYNVLQVLPVIS